MKSTVETLSPTRVRLAVEVPYDDLRPSVDKAYRALAEQIRVPGFRPGKAPRLVIDQRVGRGAVLQEAVNEALPNLYSEAAREHELQPIGNPEIDFAEGTELESFGEGTSLNFTAEVDIRPEIELPDLSGIAVTVDDAQVSDADVDGQLDELRDRFASLTSVERPAADGDYVSLDLASTIDGEDFEGGSSTGRSYVVGSGEIMTGLDEAITGKSAGDTATFTATLEHGERSGAEAEVTATVKSVKTKELPSLDDEFAQLASEFDTVEELRTDLRDRLARVRVMEQGAQARDRVLEKVIETVEFPLPESAVTAEIEYRTHDIVHSLNHDDSLFDRYLEAQGQTREQFDSEMHESAEKSVRAQFVLDAVAERDDVQIGNEELTEYLIRQAAQYQMPPQDFANQIMQSGNLPMLVADIRRNKALAAVLESAVVTDESGNTVDLAASFGDEENDGAPAGDDTLDDDALDDDTLDADTLDDDAPVVITDVAAADVSDETATS